ncbi:MAG: FeoB small GTPase domain-containing protein, partial [Candidatus Binatia bacterium]|nr:FeoB small GTPase domain-containing protein [Candidatus Binatia bacterium]
MTAAPKIPSATEGLSTIALVGSPNAGKTTLFNALTGSSAKIGNYAGVTVERREGTFRSGDVARRILDLPGTYALEGETPDEKIVHQVLQGEIAGEPLPDALLVVADATTLQRSLGLVLEAIEHGLPTLLVLTMIDEVKARGGRLDPMALSRELGVHVL